MSRCIAAVLLVTAIGVAPVGAQEPQEQPSRSLAFAAANAAQTIQPLAVDASRSDVTPASVGSVPAPVERPTTTLNVLCVSFAALQALDLHTTFRALDSGAREGNPLLGGFASNKAAMVGFKAATTAGTIYLVRKFGVRNRVASTILMAATNSAYAIIAAHNYRLANSLR